MYKTMRKMVEIKFKFYFNLYVLAPHSVVSRRDILHLACLDVRRSLCRSLCKGGEKDE